MVDDRIWNRGVALSLESTAEVLKVNDYKWQGCMRYMCGVLRILRANIRLSKIRLF